MKPANKYVWIGYTSARSNFAYFGELAARTVFMAVVLYIFLRLWMAVYRANQAETIAGLTIRQMLWYMALTEALILSSARVSVEVDRDVRSGSLAIQLLRPLSYAMYRMSTALGERLVRFGLNAAVGLTVALVLVGPIDVTVTGVVFLSLALPLALILDFMAYFLIGLCAFWLESTAGLTLIYARVTMVLGGTLLPLELFPDRLQPILRVLPFANMIYGPARLFVAPNMTLLLEVVAAQAIAIVLLAAVVRSVQKVALRRIYSNGG